MPVAAICSFEITEILRRHNIITIEECAAAIFYGELKNIIDSKSLQELESILKKLDILPMSEFEKKLLQEIEVLKKQTSDIQSQIQEKLSQQRTSYS